MNRFIFWLAIIFFAFFIFQQSHVLQKIKIKDRDLGVYRDEYQFHWENLSQYGKSVTKKTTNFFDEVNVKIKRWKAQHQKD